MPITLEEAQSLAEQKVLELSTRCDDDFIVVPGGVTESTEGWLFVYNSRDYVETGDPLSALAGNGPILVTWSGEVRQLSSAVAWETAEAPPG